MAQPSTSVAAAGAVIGLIAEVIPAAYVVVTGQAPNWVRIWIGVWLATWLVATVVKAARN